MAAIIQESAAIEALARKLQGVPAEVRWAYGQQDVIQAVSLRTRLTPGPRTTAIARFVRVAAVLQLEIVAVKLASLALLAVLYLRQSRRPAIAEGRRFFIGIGALKEAELIPQFEALIGARSTVIDQRNSATLAAIYRPGVLELMRAWRDAAQPLFVAVAAEKDGTLERSAVLTYAVRRLHHYAHFLAVFRGLNGSARAKLVGFSSADLPAYAAVRAGIETIYFPHGFVRRSLIFPDFARVVAFNAPEADHLQSRLPASAVSVSAPATRPLQVERRLAVVGNYGNKLDRSRDLIEFCRISGIDVVVLPHPADRSGYWNQWEGVRGVHIAGASTFDVFLERHRPCILASWYSTTIYEALLRGVVSVTLEAEQPDVVFPFTEVALAWPKNKEHIRRMVDDPVARQRHLMRALALTTERAYARSATAKAAVADWEPGVNAREAPPP